MLLLQILHQETVLLAPVDRQSHDQLIPLYRDFPLGQQVVLPLVVSGDCEAQDADAAQHRLHVVVGQGRQLGELEPLALKAYQRRQQGLIVLVEAGQVGVLQDIGGVTVNAAVVDGKANFVQPRRPAEDGAIGLYLHLPGLLQGIKQGQHALLHPGCLFAVHPVVGA